ncbi:Crustacean cuticle [Trinorchestia longiramus]|nr:Crustacean cuticle [Trinorchestia longiramus]
MKFLVAICALAVSASAQVGPSGIVDPSGNNIQFTHEFANNIAVVGPSGIVTRDGNNLQLTAGQASLSVPDSWVGFRSAIAAAAPAPIAGTYSVKDVVGPSGVVRHDGNNVQFSQAQADNIALVGPSGIVTRDGKNIQFTSRKRRSVPEAIIGASGIIAPDGQLLQLEPGVTVVASGPSAILLSNGKAIQYNFN